MPQVVGGPATADTPDEVAVKLIGTVAGAPVTVTVPELGVAVYPLGPTTV